ncbi:MAG: hypothetical protein R6V47_00345 [Candidatus Delongbacteria bacterium]
MSRSLLGRLFLLSVIIYFFIPSVLKETRAQWEESVTDVEYLFGESKKVILAEGYYTNGDVKSGYLDENPNVYATFTLYKGNSYSFVIGGANNLNNLRASFYGNNFVDNIFSDEVEVSNYKIFYFTPLYNGTYYLKIQSFGELEGDGEFMYYYGFKQNE